MIKALIFDFDGVVVDSEPVHFRALNVVLTPYDAGITWEDYEKVFIGFDDRDALHEAFNAVGKILDKALLEELVQKKAKQYLAFIEAGDVPVFDGAPETIRSLSAEYPIIICSGALRSDIEPILAKHDLGSCFIGMVTAEDVAKSKPHPESYEKAFEGLNSYLVSKSLTAISKDEALVIEDTPVGLRSANSAGLEAVGVLTTHNADDLFTAKKLVEHTRDISVEWITEHF